MVCLSVCLSVFFFAFLLPVFFSFTSPLPYFRSVFSLIFPLSFLPFFLLSFLRFSFPVSALPPSKLVLSASASTALSSRCSSYFSSRSLLIFLSFDRQVVGSLSDSSPNRIESDRTLIQLQVEIQIRPAPAPHLAIGPDPDTAKFRYGQLRERSLFSIVSVLFVVSVLGEVERSRKGKEELIIVQTYIDCTILGACEQMGWDVWMGWDV